MHVNKHSRAQKTV